jgi:hypothetical protein
MFYGALYTDFSTASRGKCFEAIAREGKLAADNAEARGSEILFESLFKVDRDFPFQGSYPGASALIRG